MGSICSCECHAGQKRGNCLRHHCGDRYTADPPVEYRHKKDIQNNIYQKALNYRNEHIVKVDSYDDFKEQIEKGGFILAHWDGTPETEDRIKEETKATIRCLPFDADEESLTPGKCMVTGKPSARRVLFARAY